MGLEASNFIFRPNNKISKTHFEEKLSTIETILLKKSTNESYILYTSDCWIDILLVDNLKSISIRVALCNPLNGVEKNLKKLFHELFALSEKSSLTDVYTKIDYLILNDDVYREIINNLKLRKADLESRYGELLLPVSSTLFYKYISERDGDGNLSN
jgi:hypothetical protein